MQVLYSSDQSAIIFSNQTLTITYIHTLFAGWIRELGRLESAHKTAKKMEKLLLLWPLISEIDPRSSGTSYYYTTYCKKGKKTFRDTFKPTKRNEKGGLITRGCCAYKKFLFFLKKIISWYYSMKNQIMSILIYLVPGVPNYAANIRC